MTDWPVILFIAISWLLVPPVMGWMLGWYDQPY